jgi:hypothetical protein
MVLVAPTSRHVRYLGVCLRSLAEIDGNRGDWESALSLLAEAEGQFARLVAAESDPDPWDLALLEEIRRQIRERSPEPLGVGAGLGTNILQFPISRTRRPN